MHWRFQIIGGTHPGCPDTLRLLICSFQYVAESDTFVNVVHIGVKLRGRDKGQAIQPKAK